jgi:hypothetical protein
VQRAAGIAEAVVDLGMTDWHTYAIEWHTAGARFSVDGRPVLACEMSPQGPLGFVMWLDNQYAVVTPWGRFGCGWLETPECQALEVDALTIKAGVG